MSQVLIVSNRLPISVKKEGGKLSFNPGLGGIATGLSSYVSDRKSRWIGWPGIASDELTKAERQEVIDELAKHNYTPVFLTKKQIDDFYNGYSNSVLWPLFHNLKTWESKDADQAKWWRAYRQVNEQYAQAALSLSESGSRVWIHDYQLMLVARLLRDERRDIITGFFLHIPFPTAKSLSRLPQSKKLLTGILGADVVGFHTPLYVNNFLSSCEAAGLGTINGRELLVGDRSVRVADFPMGIDYQKYAAATKSPAVKAAVRRYRRRYKGRRVIVAIDRMDPSKGLVERLKAYRTLLELYPRLHGKVVFAMVAAPSRTDIPAYQKLAKQLDKLSADINKTYGSDNWQPVDYMNVAQPFEEVTALFQVADVAFIAPLRDGMNLAAKEFVASKRKRGVLILSETAGAANELPDALLVNPKRPETLVYALQRALTMSRRELRARLKRMQQQISTQTVQVWAKDFVGTLQKPLPGTPNRTRTLKGKLELELINRYRETNKHLIMLDYDGSLVPFEENYKDAKPPKTLLRLLEKLGANPLNTVVLISGRSADDLDNWFRDLPVNLVAEHGASYKNANSNRWHTIEKVDTKWKRIIQPILQKYVDSTPGARLEVKPHSLVWHYRGASSYYAQKNTVVVKKILKPLLKTYGLDLLQGNKALEVKNPLVSKGATAERWFKHGYDFILSIGDDVTDEDLFAVLPDSAYGIKIGPGRTQAKFRLSTHKDALTLLKKLF